MIGVSLGKLDIAMRPYQDWNFLGIPLPHVPVTDKIFSKQLEGIHEMLGNVLM